jgi:hypothetical protein
MPGVLKYDHGGVGGDQFHLLPKHFSISLIAANRQHRHCQLRFRELRKIFGRLLKRNEVLPACMHPSRTRVSRRVGGAIGFKYGDFTNSPTVGYTYAAAACLLRLKNANMSLLISSALVVGIPCG